MHTIGLFQTFHTSCLRSWSMTRTFDSPSLAWVGEGETAPSIQCYHLRLHRNRDGRYWWRLSCIKIPVLCALRGFSAQGQSSNGQGWDNAQVKGECIIHPRLLL